MKNVIVNAKTNLVNSDRELVLDIIIPTCTYSEQNLNEHWAKKAKRHKAQQNMTHIALLPYRKMLYSLSKHKIDVCLTRIAPREMDYDNLVYSFKWIRDSVAENIFPGLPKGHADNHFDCHYDQKKGTKGQYDVQLKIFIK